MKYLFLLIFLCGCGQPVDPGCYTPCISTAVGMSSLTLVDNAPDDEEKVPRSECTNCNGTGIITHGDGHTSECPKCYASSPPPVPMADPVEVQSIEPIKVIVKVTPKPVAAKKTMTETYSAPQRRRLFQGRGFRGR